MSEYVKKITIKNTHKMSRILEIKGFYGIKQHESLTFLLNLLSIC